MPQPSAAHHRVDTSYLEALTQDPSAGGLRLDAAGWRQAIQHAGLQPLLDGPPPADPALAAEVEAVRAALRGLGARFRPPAFLQRLVWSRVLVSSSLLMFGVATMVAGLPSSWLVGAVALAAGVMLLGEVLSATWQRAAEEATKSGVPLALRALLRRTRVVPVQDGILEICPVDARLRVSLAALDEALHGADARIESIQLLQDEIRASNIRLGHPADDAETTRLSAVRTALLADRAEVRAARDAFLGRLDALEADLARLREVAHREHLSGLAQVAGASGPAAVRAEAEVEGAAIDADAARLSGEVHVAVARLRASVQGARLTGGGR